MRLVIEGHPVGLTGATGQEQPAEGLELHVERGPVSHMQELGGTGEKTEWAALEPLGCQEHQHHRCQVEKSNEGGQQACDKGGQAAAKDAMKAWNKEKKISSCNKCHSKLAPTYEKPFSTYGHYRPWRQGILGNIERAYAMVS